MILKYLRAREWAVIAMCVVLIACMVYLELEIPGYMSSITGDGGMMLLCAFGSLVVSIVVGGLAAWIATSFSKRLRELEYARVQSFSLEEMNRFSTSSLITRSTNDITQVQNFLSMGLRMMCFAPIMGLGGLIMGLSKCVSLAWVLALALII